MFTQVSDPSDKYLCKVCLSGMMFGETVCWDIIPWQNFGRKQWKLMKGIYRWGFRSVPLNMRNQGVSAERMANQRWTSTKSAYGLLMCACMCLHCICSLCFSASFALTWHLSFKSPCFRDYISAVKPAETAFLTLLQGKSRVRIKRKQSTLKVPIPWKWWQMELTGWLDVCTDFCPVDIIETDT